MREASQKLWWASFYTNTISRKKRTPMDEQFPRGSYHDTWAEAHAALIARREEAFNKAEREFQRARTALMKAKSMAPAKESEHG